MKRFDSILRGGMALALSALTLSAVAGDTNKVAKPFPATVTSCPVSGEKLGGDMGAPYVFTYEGQEIKLCCKSCKADFDKDPAKYIKKIADADKSAKDKKAKN